MRFSKPGSLSFPDNSWPCRLIVAGLFKMTSDNYLRAQQRQNELNAFRRYEQAFWIAYAKSKDPHPSRWIDSNHRWRVQRHGQLDALD